MCMCILNNLLTQNNIALKFTQKIGFGMCMCILNNLLTQNNIALKFTQKNWFWYVYVYTL